MRHILLSLLLLAFLSGLAHAGFLAPDLQAKLNQASPDEKLKVIVRMAEEADISIFPPGQREAMVQYLKDFASRSQKDLLASLPTYGDKVSKVKPFWIYNGIALEATKEVVLDLAKRSDVGYIEEKGIIKIEPLPGKEEPRVNGLEWNIARIEADRVWRELGYTGRGIVIGNIDTGVNVNHPTFGGRWRGGYNSWFDPVNGRRTPYDDNGHGTSTMAIACGGSTADSIGVAPGATFVATKAFDAGGTVEVDACMQWYASLGSAAPHIINNSWGSSVGSDTHYWQMTRNLQILGIHQVFSNGNSGPGSGTVGSPASYPHHIGVGGTAISDTLANWSSRGPSPSFGAMESSANYLDPNWASSRRKPDLSAPGLNVRSAWYDTTYRVMSGTSMSAPHVAGTMALMLEKNPLLTDKEIWQILTSTCDTFSFGGPYPNQNYGWGRLNAYRAVMATPLPDPQFRLNASANAYLSPNSSIVDSVTIASIGFFSQPVTLVLDSIRPPESTLSVSFNPNPVTPPPNGSVKTGMRIAALTTTPERTYLLYYHAAADTLTRWVQLTLKVQYPYQGPDAYGYYAYDNTDTVFENAPVYGWVELNPNRGGRGSSVGPGDYYFKTYRHTWSRIGVKHYGLVSDSVSICSSGWVAVGRTTTTIGYNRFLPSIQFVPNGIGVFWDDLDIYAADGGSWWYYPDTVNHRFIVQWDSISIFNDLACRQWFQVILNDTILTPPSARTRDSEILLQWKQVRDTSSITVGQQNATMDVGLNLLYNTAYAPYTAPIGPGRAVKFTTDPPRLRGVGVLSPPEVPVLPLRFALGPAIPNPSKGALSVSYDLPHEVLVSLKVYNLSGQLVRTLVSGKEKPGFKRVTWDGRSEDGSKASSGVYFYRLQAGPFTATRKMLVLR